jgi:hypothetical protein
MGLFDGIIAKGKWYYWYNSSYLVTECLPILSNPKLEYSDIVALLAFLCQGTPRRKTVFFWVNSKTTSTILNKITEKWKLQKKEMTSRI